MKRTLIALFIIAIHANILNAQPAFPQRAAEIIDALIDSRANGTDDDRRDLTRSIIEQLVCEFPNDGYGGKSADENRPFSKDSIARQIGDQLWGWDWQSGATRRRSVQPGDRAGDLTGQHFIQILCVPHLSTNIPNPGTGTTPPAPAPDFADLDAFVELLATIERRLGDIAAQNERIYADLVARLNILSAQQVAANERERKPAVGTGDRVLQILTMLFGAASTVVGAGK